MEELRMRKRRRKIVGKRFAAYLLVASMVLGMLPVQGLAAPGESLPTQVFDFKSGDKYQEGALAREIKIEDEGWEINEALSAKRLYKVATNTRFQIYGISCSLAENDNAPESDVAIDVMINESGNYMFNFCGGGYGSGGVAEIYIDSTYVGQYDFNGANVKEKEYVDMNTLYLEAGKHTVLFHKISGGDYLYIGAMTFRGVAVPPTQIFDLKSGDKYEINTLARDVAKIDTDDWEINKTLSAKRIYQKADNTRFQPYGIACSLAENDNPPESDVAIDVKISESGNYTFNLCGGGYGAGGVSAIYIDGIYVGQYDFKGANVLEKEYLDLKSLYLEAGKHTVLFRKISGGDYLYIGCMTFKGIGALPAEKISATCESMELEVGTSSTIATNIVYASGVTVPFRKNLESAGEASTIAYESSAPDILAVDENGKISAKAPGSASVKITVTAGEAKYETSLNFTVPDGNNVVFDFKSGSKYQDGALAREIKIEDEGWEINRELSAKRLYQVATNTRFQIYGISAGLAVNNNPPESDTAIDVMIPREGNYTFNFCGGGYGGGSISDIYIDGVYVGTYDFSGANVKEKEYVDMKSLYLSAGRHTVLLRKIGGGDYQYIGAMTFKSVDTLPAATALTATTDATELGIGDHGQITASIAYENGVVVPYHANLAGSAGDGTVLSFESSAPNVLTVDENGAFESKAEGSATVKITVTAGGTELTSSIAFTVLKLRRVTYDLKSGTTYPDGVLSRDFAKIGVHGWEINRSLTSNFLLTQPKRTRFQIYGLSCEVQSANNPPESDTAIDFMIPKDGDYTFNFCGGGYGGGGISSLYIDGAYVGEYNFFGSNVKEKEYLDMRTLRLAAGKHTLIVRTIADPDGTGTRFAQYIGCLTFQEVESIPTLIRIIPTAVKEDLPTGGKTSIKTLSVMSNGASYPIAPNLSGSTHAEMTVTYENLTPKVIDLDADGTITAKAPGKGTVKVSATIDGITQSANADVYIYENVLEDTTITLSDNLVFIGGDVALSVKGIMTDGSEVNSSSYQIACTFEDETIASAAEVNGVWKISGLKEGKTNLTVTATYENFKPTTISLPIEVVRERFSEISFDPTSIYLKPDAPGATFAISGKTNRGAPVDLTGAEIVYQCEDEAVASVSTDGTVVPVGLGKTSITVTVTKDGITVSGCIPVVVTDGKTSRTLYTEEEVSAARENIERYSWAREIKDKAVREADKYLDLETMWNLVTTQELPRNWLVGFLSDPNAYTCRYCGTDLLRKYYSYPWLCDPMNEPFKVQCPDCRRKFPSNDFEKYYASGIDEHGNWSYELAKQNGQEYLKNILYPEKGEGWGVDDGYGYKPGNVYANGVVESHTYIAYYNAFGLWNNAYRSTGTILTATEALRDAYLYTGDIRYGRAGAVLIDRIADVYPEMDIAPFSVDPKQAMLNSHGGGLQGKIVGCIEDATGNARIFPEAYDAFFPAMDDPQVIAFLSAKAEQYNMENKKDSGEAIRKNCEDGILRSVYAGCKDGKINGNFGMHQSALATAAVVLDNMPETGEWIDWIMCAGGRVSYTEYSGGNVLPQLVNVIDRDGHGTESAPGYNAHWLSDTIKIAEILYGYETYPSADLYQNPKFVNMFRAAIPMTLCGKTTPAIGDSGGTATLGSVMTIDNTLLGFLRTGDEELAQVVYMLNGESTDGLHASIFTKNPEAVASQVRDVIERRGTLNMEKSDNLTAYGFTVLRGGKYLESANEADTINTQRDFWIRYGQTYSSHAHAAFLNLGMEAYGLNMAPDLGYPEDTSSVPSSNRMSWVSNTISHNTVVVNNQRQSYAKNTGTPLHFDDAGKVRVIDVDAPQAYSGTTSTYRRTVVMIDASDEVSYGIDFFRVVGGKEHLYSFHSLSNQIAETEGLSFIEQKDESGNYVGSYAGRDVAWGPSDAHAQSGYSWLKNVRRADNPKTKRFAVDFKVTDFRNALKKDMDLHLRLTMLNQFEINEVSLATGTPPRTSTNEPIGGELEYMLARRKSTDGKELDTLFTTVLEPYSGERYIESMENVPVLAIEGAETRSDAVSALKITMKDGRVDYIVYASNNKVKYRVDDSFDFRGFIGVYTVKDGVNSYSYLQDGDVIGELQGTAEYAGKVSDFTRELSANNSITIAPNAEMDLENLVGRYIYIENDTGLNAVYPIIGATQNASGNVTLDIGDKTLIHSYLSGTDIHAGYRYNIATGARYTIPLSSVYDSAPVFQEIPKKITEVGSELKFQVSAESFSGKELSYRAIELPRGAQFDEKSHTFTWIPDSGQVGANRVGFEATDGISVSTTWVEIKVYGSTSGGNTGGGTTSGITKPEDNKPDDNKPEENNPGGNTTGERFVDLGGHAWARDAINRLAEKDVIKGVSENTFAPGKNITRADFVVLLVRAFALTAEDTGNFADVSKSDYFATEMGIAKTLGIVNGVGGNNALPRAEISRQDMMTILARTLETAGQTLEKADESTLESFVDQAQIAGYARDSVALLVKNGIVAGDHGAIKPNANATRAEVAVMLDRILED